VAKMHNAGKEIIMIGHAGHPEVAGTMGQCEGGMYLVENEADVEKLKVKNENEVAFVTQTTLSVDDASRIIDALKQRFPKIIGPKKDDICYATQNRQDAIKFMAKKCDLVIVVGSPSSSNSNRLRDVANTFGVEAYLIDNATELNADWLKDKKSIGVSAGASAPEVLVQEVITRLKQLGAASVKELDGITENVTFPMPKNLIPISVLR
jgi:4-hydroxy-3-methylbut-2-en-1-yl diphosphate reductase